MVFEFHPAVPQVLTLMRSCAFWAGFTYIDEEAKPMSGGGQFTLKLERSGRSCGVSTFLSGDLLNDWARLEVALCNDVAKSLAKLVKDGG